MGQVISFEQATARIAARRNAPVNTEAAEENPLLILLRSTLAELAKPAPAQRPVSLAMPSWQRAAR